MTNPKFMDELSEKISNILAASPLQDVEKNLRATVSGFLARLDLVTREEFDVQQEVLLRTREKLEALEARLAALEGAGGNGN